MQSLYTAATGMLAQQMNIDVISNNLANVNTNGFKKQRVDFQDLLYLNVKPAGAPATRDTTVPVGIQVGEGVKPVSTTRIFTQGPVQTTNNPLDLMIEDSNGAGYFFKVTRADGETVYTKDGSFRQDGQGNVVTADGYMLDPQIQIPPDTQTITVTADGHIQAALATNPNTPVDLGQLEVSHFVNPAGLEALGHNVFRATVASGDPIDGQPGVDGYPPIQQGALETSNVDVVDEMVKMIVAQRSYELNSRAVQTSDDMLSAASTMKR